MGPPDHSFRDDREHRDRRPKRSRLDRTALFLLFLLLLPGCSPPAGRETCRDCNVVIISVDTLRADHVGAYGYDSPTTPHIDALAKKGVLFENAMSQSSWTRPAHMSIFTGPHPREHGFYGLADARPLEESVPTLASVLREHGYATAGFSGGVNMASAYGFDRGFDVYRNNGKYFRDNFEDARYWLDGHADRKFFLFFHGYDAHSPYRTDAIDRSALGIAPSPPRKSMRRICKGGGPASRVTPVVDEYDGSVHRADRYVGRMLAELERRNLLERTVVVLLSDHGEEFLEHGRCFHVSTLYREVLHVPLIVAAPGLPARRVRALVSASVTIAPTVMELLGIASHPFAGPSLVAAALGGAAPRDAVVSETERSPEHQGEGHVRAWTTEEGKLLHWVSRDRIEWFDAAGDRNEMRPTEPSRAAAHSRQLEEWVQAHPPLMGSRRRASGATSSTTPAGDAGKATDEEPPATDDALRRRQQELRSLGYAD